MSCLDGYSHVLSSSEEKFSALTSLTTHSLRGPLFFFAAGLVWIRPRRLSLSCEPPERRNGG